MIEKSQISLSQETLNNNYYKKREIVKNSESDSENSY